MSTASSTLYQNKLGKLGDKYLSNEIPFSNKGVIHTRDSKN